MPEIPFGAKTPGLFNVTVESIGKILAAIDGFIAANVWVDDGLNRSLGNQQTVQPCASGFFVNCFQSEYNGCQVPGKFEAIP